MCFLFKWLAYYLDNTIMCYQKKGNLILVHYLTMKPYELKINNKRTRTTSHFHQGPFIPQYHGVHVPLKWLPYYLDNTLIYMWPKRGPSLILFDNWNRSPYINKKTSSKETRKVAWKTHVTNDDICNKKKGSIDKETLYTKDFMD